MTTQAQQRQPVLYLAGMGRSGSTLLERATAQIPGVVGVGELVFLWERGIRNDERCGCGMPFSQCAFWSEVGRVAFGGWDRVDVDRVLHLDSRVNDVRHVARLAAGRLGGRRFEADLREYVGYYERIYAAVREVTGCDLVVDSSKLTALAFALRRSSSIDLRVLHLLRDPRAVAYSWTKRVRRPEVVDGESYMPTYRPSYMAALYAGHHALLELLAPMGTPSMRVRYEDFVAVPEATLREAADFAGLRAPDLDFVEGDRVDLATVHTVAGNPSRFDTGEVHIRRDDAWQTKMPRTQRRTVGALTLPARAAYGYTGRKAVWSTQPADQPIAPRPARMAPPREPERWPSVGVVLATHDRPQMMRAALASILEQDYPGDIHVALVFDQSEVDTTLAGGGGNRTVSVTDNAGTPGLAGARNTGILGLDADLVAFCDDDDTWMPDKLKTQVAALLSQPGASFCTTAMVVDFDGQQSVRRAGTDRVTVQHLTRSRMAMLHSSSFLARRSALLGPVGLVDETLPKSMAEDWDLLIRAARVAPIVHVDEPLVRITWGASSYFADQWETKNLAHRWLLDRHPEIGSDPVGAGLMYGKLAFGHAALGERRQAVRMAGRSLRARRSEPRAFIAIGVAIGLLSPAWVLQRLNERGHGI
jgi:Glycosyl transferase family 2